ncbi:MAG: DegV family protein [Lachnospiraceae bacterium]|nr:DegV family protein [Lachnospiraceae bacterium]
MSYKIIVDSCCDLTPNMRQLEEYVVVPLTLTVGGEDIIDDESFDQLAFLRKVAQSPECPKSACPSPAAYLSEIEKAAGEDVYIVTLSGELSGSYNSAVNAKQMYEEEGGKKNVHIFNSRSAAAGEVCIAAKIKMVADTGKHFKEVVDSVESYIDEMFTYFVLESLETLRKNGRLTRLQAIIANTLNIKPVMRGTFEGAIEKVEQVRGIKKALQRMVSIIATTAKHQEDRDAVISHCNCHDRAMYVKQLLEEECHFRKVIITDTRGVSSMYANDGGVVVSA